MHLFSLSPWRLGLLATLGLAGPVLAQAQTQASGALICEDATPPPGALQVGAVQALFRDCPRLGDVDFTGKNPHGEEELATLSRNRVEPAPGDDEEDRRFGGRVFTIDDVVRAFDPEDGILWFEQQSGKNE